MSPAAPAQPAPSPGGTEGVTPTDLLDRVRRIELRARRLLNNTLLGEYRSVFKGRGMAFSDVREYVAGDDIRAIHWSVTARMNAPFVKQHEEERELTVLLLVDVSASGAFGSTGRSKLEVEIELAALLAFSAIRNNDRVGLLAFTDRIEKYVPPRKGRQHALRVIRELVLFSPRGRATNIGAALTFLGQVLRRRAVVFLISDFYAPDFAPTLRVSARQHDLVALAVTDPAELELPDGGLVRMEDAETGREAIVDTTNRRVQDAYRRLALTAREARNRLLSSLNVDVAEIRTDEPYDGPLLQLFRRRGQRK